MVSESYDYTGLGQAAAEDNAVRVLKQPNMNFAERCRDFAQASKIHGVCHIQRRGGTFKNIFWALMTLFGFCMLAVHMYCHVTNFMSTPVSTVYKHRATDFRFPDVTLCSLSPTNRIMYSRVSEPLFMGMSPEDLVLLGLLFKLEELIDARVNKADRDIYIHRQMIWHQRATRPTYRRSFYPAEEMIFSCNYQGKKCDPNDFVLIPDPQYWNCYTFRPKVRKLLSTAPDDGLDLVLYTSGTVLPKSKTKFVDGELETFSVKNNVKFTQRNLRNKSSPHDNLPAFFDMILLENAEPSGIKITIHEEYNYPLSSSQGFIVANGQYAKVGLEMIHEIKINQKDDPCTTKAQRISYRNHLLENGSFSTRDFQYNVADCRFQLYQKEIANKCGCISSKIPIRFENIIPQCHNYSALLDLILNKQKGLSYIRDMSEYINSKKKELSEFDFMMLLEKGRQLRLHSSPEAKRALREFKNSLICEKQAAVEFERMYNSSCRDAAPCNFVHYKYLMSSATWPRRFDLARLVESPILENLRVKDPVTGNLVFKPIAQALFRYDEKNHSRWATHEDLIRNNFVKIVIHPLSLKSDKHVEEYTYGLWEALGEIGGIMGLWVGMSFLTLFEIFDLMVAMACNTPSPRF